MNTPTATGTTLLHPRTHKKARHSLMCLCLFLLFLSSPISCPAVASNRATATSKPFSTPLNHESGALSPSSVGGRGGTLPYRGFMLDVSRHFFRVEFIMKQIDAMETLHLNRLHLHLTDAGGWRMEMKSYPALTQRTAFRTQSDWVSWWNNGDRRYVPTTSLTSEPSSPPLNHASDSSSPSTVGEKDGAPYGGFYTQDDLRRLVDYAHKHGIEVIPEIEMPGHSEEVLFAYPELQCPGSTNTGSLCIGNDSTLRFLERVLDEVMEVFPSEIIHIGGDEANASAWLQCPRCQKRMADHQLKNAHELQAFLTRHIAHYLADHGRRLAGWDEIVDAQLDMPVVVYAWRGYERAETALKAGHDVVLTPTSHCYLDYYQDAPASHPLAMGDYTPLDKVMTATIPTPPADADDSRGHVIGLQGNLWTEMVETPGHAEWMMYPRLIAIAQLAEGKQLAEQGQPTEDARMLISAINDALRARGYHCFDLRKEQGQRPEAAQHVEHAAQGKRVTYRSPYADVYRGQGEGTLTDGQQGGWSYHDGRWQGFISRGRLDVVIDMGRKTRLSDIRMTFMQNVLPEVYEPVSVVISISNDGKQFRTLYQENTTPDLSRHYLLRQHLWEGKERARYIRVQADASPEHGGWVFTDEIIVNQK